MITASWWLIYKVAHLPSLSNLFQEQPVVIDKTAVIVTNIKALAQLVTISAYDEIVVDSTIMASGKLKGLAALYPALSPMVGSNQKIALIGKTTTNVGLNMQKVKEEDIVVIKDSLHITLPPAEVLEVILNPKDVEIFDEQGEWSNTAITNLKNKITYLAAENAKSLGLLAQSEKKAKEILTSFFKATGYNKISFSFQTNK
jgi:hypothetical protein